MTLVSDARRIGWETALYNYSKSCLAAGERRREDLRSADWLSYLPLRPDDVALVLGCGLGTVPAALTEYCRRVVAVDRVPARLAFLHVRSSQQRLRLHAVEGDSVLPFRPETFDLISISAEWSQGADGFRHTVQQVAPLLKSGGYLHLNLENRWSPMRLGRVKAEPHWQPLSAAGYAQALRVAGFCDVDIYAVLPSHDGIPLFFVPLHDSRAMAFFLRHIFPLFLMVSPEVKQAYGVQLAFAYLGVRLALAIRATALVRHFVPGFCILAKCSGADSDY